MIASVVRAPLLLGLVLLVLGLSACAATTPRPVGHPPTIPEAQICLAADPAPLPGSCGKLYTTDGYLCTLCQADRACVDARSFSYCVGDRACDDPACDKLQRKK